MSRLVWLIAVVSLFTTACSKKSMEVELVSDCTGSYLQTEKHDYKVCNAEMLEGIEDGTMLDIKFKKIDECPKMDSLIFCELYHPFKSWVEVESIK